MTREDLLLKIELLEKEYRKEKIDRATYLKKHKSITNEFNKANYPTFSQIMSKNGIKVKRQTSGWYTYIGINFSVGFSQQSCESTWWEVDLYEDNVDPRVFNHFEDYNQFDRKADVLESLYNFDKSLTFKK